MRNGTSTTTLCAQKPNKSLVEAARDLPVPSLAGRAESLSAINQCIKVLRAVVKDLTKE